MHLFQFLSLILPNFENDNRKSSLLAKLKKIFYNFFICLNILSVV